MEPDRASRHMVPGSRGLDDMQIRVKESSPKAHTPANRASPHEVGAVVLAAAVVEPRPAPSLQLRTISPVPAGSRACQPWTTDLEGHLIRHKHRAFDSMPPGLCQRAR